MRAYLEVMKTYFKAQLSWRFNIASNMLFSVVKVLFAVIVWGAVFDGKDEVAGFTLGSLLSYYVVSSFFSQLERSNDTGWAMSRDVRAGSFSKYMVLPVSVQGYFLARNAGIVLLSSAFVFGACALWAVLFQIPLGFTNDPRIIACALAMEGLALVFVQQLNYLIGLWSIVFLDIGTFIMIKDNLAALLTGGIVPLVLLPEGLLRMLRLLPFYYVSYLPSMLLVGRNADEAKPGMLILTLWVLLMAAVNPLCYGMLKKRYDGVGI